jgi:HK97 gp10 family phage protein
MSADISAQVDDLINDFRAYGEKVHTNIGKEVLKGCLKVERTAKESFRPSDAESGMTGSFEFWLGPTQSEPPRVQTGRLRASITHRIVYEDEQVIGEVGTNVEYALPLEYGTSKMPPYPFMGPAYEKHAEEISEAIEKAEMEAEGAFHA